MDPFSGVASSLLRCGLPAVVGMQAEITDEAAITFSEQLYTALAQGFPIDAALAQARRAIFAAGSDVEFGTPVLFLRGQDTRLFEVDGAEVLEELPPPDPTPEPTPRPPTPTPPAGWRKALPWAAAVLALAVLAFVLLTGGDDGGGAIRVGSAPIDLAVSAGAVWTSNQVSGDISKVDLESRERVDRIGISSDARLSSIAAGLDSLWVLNVQTNRLLRVAMVTKDITPIPLPGRPTGVTAGGGRVWVTVWTTPARLVEIDPSRNAVARTFEVGANPEDVRFARDALWVTSATTGSITRVELDGTITRIPIGGISDDAAVGAGAVWVTNRDDDRITRIDLDRPVAGQVRIRVGRRPEGIAADQRNVWIVNQGDSSVTRLDAHHPRAEADRHTVGAKPSDVAVDESGVAWVVNTGDNTLSRLEP